MGRIGKKRNLRCSWLGTLAVTLLFSSQGLGGHPFNVLFIGVDDMRVELNCYAETPAISPNLDGLAAQGTLFERAYCQQAVCNPSRASMLTGLRPDRLRVWDLPTHFRTTTPNVVTLPQLFKRQGYQAIDVGKIFHNWRQDEFRGDPRSWSQPAVMHYASHSQDKPVVAGEIPVDLSETPRTEIREVPDSAYFDGRIAELAIAQLERLHSEDASFFLAVGFWKPHAPFNAPKRYWDLYDRSKLRLPSNPEPPEDVPQMALHDSREILRGFEAETSEELKDSEVLTLRHGYYAAISYVDAQIGKVLAALERLGLRETTIVVFWSDHGFHLGEHGLWAKTSNFELDARVPLIFSVPGMPKSQRASGVVELLDVYPTLVDLCELEPPAELQGVSLRPMLQDASASVKKFALTQHTRPAYPSPNDPLVAMGYSLRSESYRYTEWRDIETREVQAAELYDHLQDPLETVNYAARPGYGPIVQQLSEALSDRID